MSSPSPADDASILAGADAEIYRAIQSELDRQRYSLDLIASENFASLAVIEAQASVLTNKYAEGYPAHRYYAGCEFIDDVENLARQRLIELFGAEHVNVQPHSGTQANMAVYLTALQPGDTLLGMSLSAGGHLSHGHKVNFSGQLYRATYYGVSRENERLDYDEIRRLALQVRPKLIVAGASAYPRTIDFRAFRQIADEAGALLLCDIAHIAGLVAAGLHPSPVPHADFVTTTTHKTLRGPRGGVVMCRRRLAETIDRAVFPGVQGGPLMHVIAAKAVAFREARSDEFRDYQRAVVRNAQALAAALQDRGFRVVSGGTDNHLMLVDLGHLHLTGAQAEDALAGVGIIVNLNAIPFDTRRPDVASGIRLGTPAVTTRGMSPDEMDLIADLIDRVLRAWGKPEEQRVRSEVAARVQQLCEAYPLYPQLSAPRI